MRPSRSASPTPSHQDAGTRSAAAWDDGSVSTACATSLGGGRRSRPAGPAEDAQVAARRPAAGPDKLASFVLGVPDDGPRPAPQRPAAGAVADEVRRRPGATREQPSLPRLDDDRLALRPALRERERSVVVLTFYDEKPAAKTAAFLGRRRQRPRDSPSRNPATARLHGGASHDERGGHPHRDCPDSDRRARLLDTGWRR